MGTSIIYSKGGAAASTVQNMAATGSVTAWNSVVTQSSAGATTVTLPAALAAGIGTSVTIRNTGTGVITVAPFAGNTLAGQTSIGAGGAVTYTVTAAGTVVTSQDVTPASGSTPIVSVMGYFDVGDVGGGTTGALPVSGQVLSATKTNVDGGTRVVVTIPDMGNTTYPLWLYTEGLGSFPQDTASMSPVIGFNKTATSFSIYVKADDEVFLAGAQQLRVNVYAMSSLPTATTAAVNASLVPVTVDGLFTTPTDAQVPSALAVKTYVDENTRVPVVKTFTAAGTYTPTVGLKWAEVEAVGGGGGSGGCAAGADSSPNIGGAGGAGAYAKVILTAAQIGASQAVAIGAAGTAGAATPTAGGTGGTTTFGTLFSCPGGLGGAAGVVGSGGQASRPGAAGGAAPTVTVGVVRVASAGDAGDFGNASTGTSNAAIGAGNGGSTLFGRGGLSGSTRHTNVTAAGQAGVVGIGFGSGAAGSYSAGAGGIARAGAVGRPGYLVVTEYF